MTVTVSKEVEFDAGHRVPNHESKCRHPHGHRYRVRVTCDGEVNADPLSPEYGMVIDFGVLKQLLTANVHDLWDHAMIVHTHDHELLTALAGHDWRVVEVPCVPTAENIARMVHDLISGHLPTGLTITTVEVWETPTSLAVYRP